jgi:ribosomal protein L32
MAFWPKKKHSKSRSRTRTSNWIKLTARKLKNRVVLNKDETGLAHFMTETWEYNWRVVLRPKTKKSNVTRI